MQFYPDDRKFVATVVEAGGEKTEMVNAVDPATPPTGLRYAKWVSLCKNCVLK